MDIKSLRKNLSQAGVGTALLRITVLVCVIFSLFLGSFFFFFIPNFEKQLMNQKRETVRELTNTAWCILAEYREQAEKGWVPEHIAKNMAVRSIQSLRYGPEHKDYFWINDTYPRMIMHPYRPDLVGENLSDFRDPAGKRLFKAFVDEVQNKDAGYVRYTWQWKDDPDRIVQKISYVRLFEPWNWVLGTGIYLEDVREDISAAVRRFWWIFFGISIIAFGLCVYIVLETAESERLRRKAEERLRDSEKLFRTLGEEAPFGITVQGAGRRFEYINPQFTRIFGYTSKDLPDKETWFQLAYPDEAYRKEVMETWTGDFQEAWRPYESKARTFTVRCKDGKDRNIQFRGVSLRGGKQLMTYEDKTDQQRMQESVLDAERMKSIGTLAGGVAHDFNNLLTGIQGNVSLLLMDKDPEHPDFKRIRNIGQCARKGAELSKQLLGFARRGRYQPVPTNLNQLVQESVEMFGRTKREINIHVSPRLDLWTVEADKGQIEQVLLNLYVNAWQAMGEGGEMGVETENVVLDEKEASLLSLRPGRYVKLQVKDAGCGMDREILPRIFEPFFTTKEVGSGTGLGLASAYGIVKSHGGSIKAASEKGKGSTFTIHLPAFEQENHSENVERSEGRHDRISGKQNGSILVVDDEKSVLDVCAEMLEFMGYRVYRAGSGGEALRIYREHLSDINLVILDMIMPDIGGGEVFDRLRLMEPSVKVILSSGYSKDGRAAEILQRGCSAFMQKPFNFNDLSSKVESSLKGGA